VTAQQLGEEEEDQLGCVSDWRLSFGRLHVLVGMTALDRSHDGTVASKLFRETDFARALK
jgi:hypothetical protein